LNKDCRIYPVVYPDAFNPSRSDLESSHSSDGSSSHKKATRRSHRGGAKFHETDEQRKERKERRAAKKSQGGTDSEAQVNLQPVSGAPGGSGTKAKSG